MGRVKPATSVVELELAITQALRRTAQRPSITGYTPQDHQIPFHASKKAGRLFIGGNRSGKTVGGGAETVAWLSGNHEKAGDERFRPPVRGRAVGVDFDNGVKKIMMPEVARWIPPSLLKNGSWEDSYAKGEKFLTLTNGSTLEFMSYDQEVEKFAGTSRHFVWFDEEPPEDIFNECLLRLVDTRGRWWMTMTPLIEMSWTFDRLYESSKDGLNPGIDVFEVHTAMNKYVNLNEVEVLFDGISDEEKDARLRGTYIQQSGTIYGKVIDPRVNYIGDLLASDRWPLIYDKWGHFGMLDHGYTNPTAFLLGAYDEEGRVIIYDEYYHTKRLVHENAGKILERIRDLKLEDKIDYIVADPSIRNTDPISGTSILSEYADHGLFLSLGNNDVDAGILRVSSRFKNKQLFITSRCEKLKWELGRYRWDKFASSKIAARRNLKETPLKKDDHACDALRYGLVSRPMLEGEVDVKVGNLLNTPTARSDWDSDFELLAKLGEGTERPVYDYNMGDDF